MAQRYLCRDLIYVLWRLRDLACDVTPKIRRELGRAADLARVGEAIREIVDALEDDYADLGCTADVELTEVLKRDVNETRRCIR